MSDPIVWTADERRAAGTHTARFMRDHGAGSYQELVDRSQRDPETFWDAVVRYLGIPFVTPYQTVMEAERGPEWATWFTDGTLNLSAACADRWAGETPDGLALISEHEDGKSTSLTFAQLTDRVSRLAGGLVRLGVDQGDAVAVFLPMSSQAVIALLAVARIGAIFIPIFSGYAPHAVARRLEDPRPKVLICADGFTRRGRPVEMKEVADEAAEIAGGIERMVVADYARRSSVPWRSGRDVAWSEAASADPLEYRPVPAEHPFMVAYTSGTTGRPKGAVHVHGGFTVKVAQEGAFCMDVHPGDRFLWATDMGWIMGPWTTVAALANGSTLVTYDGAPDHPDP
ncbi:MAG: AMP-binding protein, partial [Actinomycetota bacterium]